MRHRSRWLIGMTAGLVLLLSPAWALADRLEIPGNGVTMSGIGVISGWKCEAGDITVRLDEGDPIPTLYEFPRGDTSGICGDANNGFVTYFNWAILSDGEEHTAVAYDDGVEFSRTTFSVATLGEEFVVGAAGECTIEDFPSVGESATFKWNQSTQHLELVPIDPDLVQFNGTWTAHLDPTDAVCSLPDFPCTISNGAVSCLGGLVQGTVDSSGSVVGIIDLLEDDGELSGTISSQDGSGDGIYFYSGCEGTWTLTKQ